MKNNESLFEQIRETGCFMFFAYFMTLFVLWIIAMIVVSILGLD